MKNSYKIRHKKEGWTGTLVIEGINPTSWASHYMGINILANIIQDPKDTRWNAPIEDEVQREMVINRAVHYQASAWASSGRLFVPYYRQAHIRSYDYYNQGGKEAFRVAYSDVKAAFEYYLTHYNQGRPIIIASHSQGTTHTKR